LSHCESRHDRGRYAPGRWDLVKSGVVRVMELEEQGWTYVKP